MNLDNIKDPIFVSGLKVLRTLSEHGEAYIVGGAVRDLVMGNAIHDVDISTNVPMDVIEALFETHDIGKNKDFGIVVIVVDGINFEIAQFRGDGKYLDGRHPESVEFGVSFEEDTKRRDFTMNSLGLDLAGNIIDYHGGLEDIKSMRLRTVGKALDRFGEDALRILRAIRFAARFGYELDDEICEAIFALKLRLIGFVSKERIRDEMFKTMEYGANKFARALLMMEKTDLIGCVFTLALKRATKLNGSNGETLVQSVALALKDYAVRDPVVQLGILFQTLSRQDCEMVCEYLKLTSDDTRDILYIHDNLGGVRIGNYDRLLELDKQVALKIIQNRAFSKLKIAYSISCRHGDDLMVQNRKIRKILTFAPILDKQKDVNTILLAMGFKGKAFGDMLAGVKTWMFDKFENTNKVAEDSEIKEFILNQIAVQTKGN